MKILFITLFFMIFPLAGFSQDDTSGYVQVTIDCESLFPANLQVRDDVCKPPRDVDCEKARIKAQGESCRQDSFSGRCKEARELLESSFCIPGLIFDGRVARGEKITVSVCSSSAGFGNLSIRNTNNGPIWTNYVLIQDGSVISYP